MAMQYNTYSPDQSEGTELQGTDVLHKEGEDTQGGQLHGGGEGVWGGAVTEYRIDRHKLPQLHVHVYTDSVLVWHQMGEFLELELHV